MIKIIIFSFFFSTISFGSEDLQVVSLERMISTEVTEKLNKIIGEGNFNVDTSIKLKKITKNIRNINIDKAPKEEDVIVLRNFDLPLPSYLAQQKESDSVADKEFSARISSINTTIVVDEKIKEDRFNSAKSLMEKMPVKMLGKQALMSFVRGTVIMPPPKALDLIEVPKVEPPEKTFYELNEKWIELGAKLALPLIILIIGFLMVISFSKIVSKVVAAVKEIKDQDIKAQAQHQIEIESTDSRGVGAIGGGAGGNIVDDSITDVNEVNYTYNGITKFINYMNESKESATILMKKIIYSNDQFVVHYIAKSLTSDKLSILKDLFNNHEKVIISQGLSEELSFKQLKKADKLLESYIVREIMAPSWNDIPELEQAITKAKIPQIVQCMEGNAELGGVLVNILPSDKVALSLSKVNHELGQNILKMAATVDMEQIEKYKDKLVKLFDINSSEKVTPFLDSIDAVITGLDRETEALVFQSLKENSNIDKIRSTAMEHFPSELVESLTPAVIGAALDSLKSEKINFIISLDEKIREFYLNCIGDPGSKKREMIDIDLEEAMMNTINVARVKKQGSELWKSFITNMRLLIKNNHEYQFLAEEVIDEWLMNQDSDQQAS